MVKEYKSITKEEIDKWISEEFGDCYSKYQLYNFTWKQIEEYNGDAISGVYIFFNNNNIWKIGKHHVNAVVRSRAHVRDNTGSSQNKEWEMRRVLEYPECEILIYSPVIKPGIHWIHALETFLELKAREAKCLLVKSARVG